MVFAGATFLLSAGIRKERAMQSVRPVGSRFKYEWFSSGASLCALGKRGGYKHRGSMGRTSSGAIDPPGIQHSSSRDPGMKCGSRYGHRVGAREWLSL
jgi:hypothetical protein